MSHRIQGREVLRAEAAAIEAVAEQLDQRFEDAVEAILACPGRLVVCGIGKSGHVGRKIVATFSSTGTPAMFLHPAEAVHGDLGRVRRGDVVVLLSYSGETEEIVDLALILKADGVPRLGISNHGDSTLARQCDVQLSLGHLTEACPLNLAPTASTTTG